MVEFGGLGGKVHDQVSQAGPARELGNKHGHELAPPVKRAEFLAAMMCFSHVLKFMSGKKCNDLPGDCFMVRPWLGSHWYDGVFFAKNIVTKKERWALFKGFNLQFCKEVVGVLNNEKFRLCSRCRGKYTASI